MKGATFRDWIDPTRLYDPRRPAGRLLWLWGSYVLPAAILLTILLSTLFAVSFTEGMLGYTETTPAGKIMELLTIGLVIGYSLAWVLMSIRRFRDLGRSGWNVLMITVPVINLGILMWLAFGTGTNEPTPVSSATNPPLRPVEGDVASAGHDSSRDPIDVGQAAGSDRPHEKPPGPIKLIDLRLWLTAIGIGLSLVAVITAVNVVRATLMSSRASMEAEVFLGALLSNACGNLIVFSWIGLPAALAHRFLSRKYSPLSATIVLSIVGMVAVACIGGYALLPLFGSESSDYVSEESSVHQSNPGDTLSEQATQDLCSWYLMTQLLRTQRVSGQSELLEFIQKHGLDLSAAEEIEFIDILVRYQPYQQRFISGWEDLGAHPEAEEFWQKEWDSVMLRIVAIDGMERGVKLNDSKLLQESWELFIVSQDAGHEAESAMMDVRARCQG